MSVFNFIEWRDLYIGIVYPWLCFLLFKSTTCMIAQKWKRNQQQQQNPTAAVAAAATATASNMQKFNKKPDENLFHLTLHLTASSHKRWWNSVLCIIFFCALYVFRCSSESMKTNSHRKFRYYLVSIYIYISAARNANMMRGIEATRTSNSLNKLCIFR